MVVFGACVVVVTLAAVALIGVVLWAQAARAKEQQATLLGIVERMRPGAAVEQARAEIVRAEATPAPPDSLDEEVARRLVARAEAIRTEEKDGHTGFIAEGRAAMRLTGLDPDDPSNVLEFNSRYGVM